MRFRGLLLMGLISGALLAPSNLASAASPTLRPFPAAKMGTWAMPAVAYLCAEGILKGVQPGHLGGTALVTQEQAITLIGRTLGWNPKFPQHPSPQVDGFAQAYVAEAQTLGVDLTFPRAPLSRLQAVRWLVTLLHLPAATMHNPFTDVPALLAPPILSAVQAGIVQGTSPTTFDPLGEVTRLQFASILFTAQLVSPGSGATQVDGATYLSRDGITLIQQGPEEWAMLTGATGLRSVQGALRTVTVLTGGTSITVTQVGAAGTTTTTITVAGDVLTDAAGASVTLPQGVPVSAGVFMLPLP